MHAEPTPQAESEVCDACGGTWIDWFDGEVHAIAAEQEAVRAARGVPLPGRASQPNAGTGACPRCTRALVPELYPFPDTTGTELLDGVDLLRCPDCAGAFVPRGSAHLLLDRLHEPRAPGALEALVQLVRQLLGRPSVR
ncbi:MAG: hypothetical protein JWP97_3795 [Labilithrix sp.]|nr:hypothetical protein [Labilithrix sp.]